MPPYKLPPSLARRVSKRWAVIVAPLYLLALMAFRGPGPEPWLVALAPLLAIAAFGYAAVDYLLAWRDGTRVPDKEPIMVWGAVLAMELHAAVPAIGRSRIVPAALFFALGYGFPAGVSLPVIAGSAAWLGAGAVHGSGAPGALISIGAMAVAAGGAGIILRRRRGSAAPDQKPGVRPAGEGHSLVLPWETPEGRGPEPSSDSPGDAVLRRREAELLGGIQRTLEALLPLTGAAHVAFVSPSRAPGRASQDGILVSQGAPHRKRFAVPDTYVPVRESVLFRKPFFETGAASGRFAPWDAGKGARVNGVAAVPVFDGDTVEGVLLAYREDEGPWDAPVLPLLELAAYFVGREIERTRVLHQGERYLLRQDWYYRVVRRMAQAGSSARGGAGESLRERRERVYAEAVGEIRRQVGAQRAALIGTSDGGARGWLTWQETEDGGGGGSDRPEPLRDTYVGWVIRTGTQRLFADVTEPPGIRNVLPAAWTRTGERSVLLLPLGEVGGFRGAVVCTHLEPARFRKQHAEIARDISEVMQLGLSHVERIEMLTQKASVDPLTGMANRRAFLEQVAADLSRLDGRHPCALLIVDIDHFKRINDTYGHPFGDEVLQGVAGILRKAVRKGDAAGRYGGEEFVLYLHMADPLQAKEGAERFRRMIRQAKFLHEGRPVTVTASFGIACAPLHGLAVEELLKRADEALYLSKQRGRDRVTVYPG
ncbi:MAG: diguanylate cyclase domain-containing protein [Verrucomicrobiota bacterium]